MSSENIVCIESIITSFGLIDNIFSSIFSIFVSDKNNKLSFFTPNLSALSFICSPDSSPEIYRTFPSVFILLHICSIRVDLPIPGSPPSKIKEPLTSPPPKTRSNSLKPVLILDSLFPSILFNSIGLYISF